MPDNGAGTYSLPSPPFAPNTVISTSTVNGTLNDLATALNARVTRNGESAPSANLPMSGFRHTGVGDAVARDQYPSTAQVQDAELVWGGTAAGTANALTISLTPGPSAYAQGQRFGFRASATNTGAATLNVSALGTKDIVMDDGVTPLGAGAIRVNRMVEVLYDGTSFVLLSPSSDAWKFLGQTILTGTSSAIVFTLPSGFTRFRLEFSRLIPTVAAALFARFSFDGGSTYASGASEYNYSLTDIRTGGSMAAGALSYIPISNTTTSDVFGMMEFASTNSKHTLFDATCPTTEALTSRIVGTSNNVTGGTATNILLGFVSTTFTSGGRVRLLGGL